MKKQFTLILILLLTLCKVTSYAQGVAINTTGAAPAAMLHVVNGDGTDNVKEILRIDRNNTAAVGGNNIGLSLGLYLEDGASNLNKAASIDAVFIDATDGSEDSELRFNHFIAGASSQAMTIASDGNVGIGGMNANFDARLKVIYNPSSTNTVLPLLKLARTTTGAASAGIGASIQMTLEDAAGTTDLSGMIAVDNWDATDGSEDGELALTVRQNGALSQVATFNTSWGPFMEFNHIGSTVNNSTLETMRIIRQVAGGNGANNIGQKWSMFLENANGINKSAVEMASTFVDAANNGEDADFKIANLMNNVLTTNFGIWETGNVAIGNFNPDAKLHVQLADGNTDIRNVLKLTHMNSGGNGVNGIGGTVIFESEDNAGNIENIASIDAQLEDATNGSEKGTLAFSIKQAGSMTELLRLDGTDQNVGIGQSVPSAKLHVFGSDDGNNTMPMLRLERLKKTGNGAANNGGAIQYFLEDDAGNSETMASLDVVLDVATNAGNAEEATLRFLTKVGGAPAVTEQMRIDGTKGYVGIGATNPISKLHLYEDIAPNNSTIQMLTIERSAPGGAGADNIGASIAFDLEDAGDMETHAKISARLLSATNNSENAGIEFFFTKNGTNNTNIMNLFADNGGYMDMNGGIQLPVKSITGATTLDKGDFFVKADAVGGAFTITLPLANTTTGQVYIIKRMNAGGNLVTIDGNGGDTIDGSLTFDIGAQNARVMIISDGANWQIID